ncbi:hypothetical protein [Luteolibacter sp. AS25]|uniref:hypothetical protein n=1 Tax=Luteolibacter sp. AS25 TaxID=3135776 RepID=UPI00398B31AD
MQKLFFLPLVAVLAAGFTSCVPSTPASRIAERPSAFERLSEKEKDLVEQGRISEGMSKEAVSLAWGSPEGRAEGLKDGKKIERWDYIGTRPVVTNNFYGGYRSGYYGRYDYTGVGFGLGPTVSYVPERTASVWFQNERVDAWEQTQ